MESMVFSSIILDDLLDYPKLTMGRCDVYLGFLLFARANLAKILSLINAD